MNAKELLKIVNSNQYFLDNRYKLKSETGSFICKFQYKNLYIKFDNFYNHMGNGIIELMESFEYGFFYKEVLDFMSKHTKSNSPSFSCFSGAIKPFSEICQKYSNHIFTKIQNHETSKDINICYPDDAEEYANILSNIIEKEIKPIADKFPDIQSIYLADEVKPMHYKMLNEQKRFFRLLLKAYVKAPDFYEFLDYIYGNPLDIEKAKKGRGMSDIIYNYFPETETLQRAINEVIAIYESTDSTYVLDHYPKGEYEMSKEVIAERKFNIVIYKIESIANDISNYNAITDPIEKQNQAKIIEILKNNIEVAKNDYITYCNENNITPKQIP
jgi:hypothetical protein